MQVDGNLDRGEEMDQGSEEATSSEAEIARIFAALELATQEERDRVLSLGRPAAEKPDEPQFVTRLVDASGPEHQKD